MIQGNAKQSIWKIKWWAWENYPSNEALNILK